MDASFAAVSRGLSIRNEPVALETPTVPEGIHEHIDEDDYLAMKVRLLSTLVRLVP